jgi:pyruvate dehydrogenase E2 component (dihydrolipoamide acetyltransferase)
MRSQPRRPAATETAKGSVERIEPTRAQSLIARRMSESRATVPDFTLESEIHAARLADLRAQLRELDEGSGAPTVNDLIVKACALALRDHRELNGAWRDGAFEIYERINIGIAAATPDGLVVPVVFDADIKDLHEIAAETRALVARAREATITPPELSGGTFSISNLGMFGIDRFTAVINPPQSAMLAVGAMRDTAIVEEGEIVAGKLLSLTLAVDHRAVYGAPAAAFLATVRERLEAPASLLG